MKMMQDPDTKLILPEQFIDEKESLKASINEIVDKAVNAASHIKENYFLTIHAKFNEQDPTQFRVDAPKATMELPQFISNSFVFWVSPKRGICEMLWMIPPKLPGEKLQPRFNTEGVAYLQAKGAMPS